MNYSDGMTKNQPDKLFTEHSTDMHNGTLKYHREDVNVKWNNNPEDGQTDTDDGMGRG
jgi:hypothetical protein